MKYAELANAGVLEQPVYEPGKPIEYVAREFGLDPNTIAKLASNENPFGPSPKALRAAQASLGQVQLYPDGGCCDLRRALAAERGVQEDQIIVGNGSNEILELLGHAFLRPGVEVVMGAQAFIVYKLVTKLFGATPVEVPMSDFGHNIAAMRAAVTDRTRLLFVASPNNPTGIANTAAELRELAETLPEHVIFCLDEAYAEYLESAPDLRQAISAGRKVICTRTFSKIYGLGGLRVGYAYGDADLIALLNRVRQPFNVNSIALAAAEAAITDHEFTVMCRRENDAGRQLLVDGLTALGCQTVGGHANFVLSNVGHGMQVFERLQRRGMIVRPLAGYGMPEYIRITIGRPEENRRLLDAMAEVLQGVESGGIG
ncbi:histidinol-phosphate transaminase [Coraliomargarita akajimensis]|uniref:Histidinol-phosphate aminotransferase n=1 Tax=Coraliomargarita akajimensis (strain DSM 45221 / IAM 15411 / JCM 23193 / KCTC 12865 / 04OKA010-24) TaxID=583355 RepID=D5ENH2_CORAD|nr:histidinol-phosphate transaminase [Coraliomargarita akajimensis]ADE55448.1 histidinol-phosphate aminotransferase [Coraliomargarita akajimensis DSM 45221]